VRKPAWITYIAACKAPSLPIRRASKQSEIIGDAIATLSISPVRLFLICVGCYILIIERRFVFAERMALCPEAITLAGCCLPDLSGGTQLHGTPLHTAIAVKSVKPERAVSV